MPRVSFVLAALLVPLLGLASASLADSHASAEPSEPAKPAEGTAGTEGGVEDAEVAGGRDISAQRDPKLIWAEMVQIRDKMYEVADDRDMRALVLSPQEQALFVAFSKRLYDLSKELTARTRPDLSDADRIRMHRSMQQFRASLGEIRTIAGSPVHRDLPNSLNSMTLQMKGVWVRFPDAEKVLGPESLPPSEDLKPRPLR